MNGKDKFVRFFNHYMGADCDSFEDLVDEVEDMDIMGDSGMYTMLEVIEQYFREEK